MQAIIQSSVRQSNNSALYFDIDLVSHGDIAVKLAKRILAEVMVFRRVPESTHLCDGVTCPHCAAPHLSKIISSIEKNEPVTFVLPAFPGKSPNTEKVLGYLPDYAEAFSLKFLNTLSQKIKQYYAPGIKIIICSDGRVFSDVVGIKEVHITEYQLKLDEMIRDGEYSDLSTFNLDDVHDHVHFTAMREDLMQTYGESLEVLKDKVRQGKEKFSTSEAREANRMYSGITRFLFEDAKHAQQAKSNTAIQKEARIKAYEVIRRSNAWSKLIANYFPDAVRLSIHPQTCGSKKLGIRLVANESWMTPWHGVAVETAKGVVLLKRSEAEALGAELIYTHDGKASHYQLREAA